MAFFAENVQKSQKIEIMTSTPVWLRILFKLSILTSDLSITFFDFYADSMLRHRTTRGSQKWRFVLCREPTQTINV
jgi:hypothetical protein